MRLDTNNEAWDATRMIQFRTFTAAEAAKISGVNMALQRDWRRRGILPPLEGRIASFTPFELGKLMALNALAEQDLSPLSVKGVANKMGASIAHMALLAPEAWTGPYESAIPPRAEGLDAIEREAASPAYERVGLKYYAASAVEGWRRHRLASQACRGEGYAVEQLRVFVRFAEGSFDFFQSAMTLFEEISDDDPRMCGAIIVLRLDALAAKLLKLAGPLAHLDADEWGLTSSRAGVNSTAQRMFALGWKPGQSDD